MAMVDADDNCKLLAESESLYIYQGNQLKSQNGFSHDDSTINITLVITDLRVTLYLRFADFT